jgi:hypothetical protein
MATLSTSQSKRSGRSKPRASSSQGAVENPKGGARAPANLHAMIAEAAYYRAERRGFAPGLELEDWLQSEAELAARTVDSVETELH